MINLTRITSRPGSSARGTVGDADAIPAISPRLPNTHRRIDILVTAA
jgi:hypothetical protein